MTRPSHLVFWLSLSVSVLVSILGKFLADTFLRAPVHIIGSFAGLRYSLNPGVAFGIMLPGGIQTLLIGAALILVAVVGWRTSRSILSKVAFGLIVGGALGNLLDRLRDGVVTDFFQVGTFPIFNVADSCITIGVGLLLVEAVMQWKSGVQGKG